MRHTDPDAALDALTAGLEAAVGFHERMTSASREVDEPDLPARVCAVAYLVDALELPIDGKTWGFILEARALLLEKRACQDDEGAELGGEG